MDYDQQQSPDLSQQNQQVRQNVNAPSPDMSNTTSMGGPQFPNLGASNPNVVAQPAVNHDTLFGRAAKALMGHTTSYSIDGQGNTVATDTPQKPGQFFRNIIAAAILGGAAGDEAHARNPQGRFLSGAVQGAGAEMNDQRNQDLQRQAQARQEFKQRNEATEEQRRQQGFATQETLRQAQIAQANSETYRTNLLTQGEGYRQHVLVADAGKQHFSDYEAADITPIFKDVPETEMQATLQNRPGASALDWEPTGVKTTVDPATGKIDHQYTYSSYDPKTDISVSQGTIDQWKKDGLQKFYPELFDMVKAGKVLTAQQYITIKHMDAKLFNDNLVRQKADSETAEGKARINLQNAQAAHALAETSTARLQGQQIREGKNQQQSFNLALDELNQADGDFSKLKPKSKVLIGESLKTMMPALSQEIRDAVNNNDDAKAHELMNELDSMRHLATQALGVSSPSSKKNDDQPDVPPGAMTAKNPKTGARLFSTDGGKTWQEVGKTSTRPQNTNNMLSNEGVEAPSL